jgi:hypothetical protein
VILNLLGAVFFALSDDTLVPQLFGIRTAAANWFAGSNANLLLGLFLLFLH